MTHLLLTLFAALTLASAPASAQTFEPLPAAEPWVEVTTPPVPEGWVTERGPWVRVHGHPDTLPAVLRVARHASDALPRLAEALGVPVGGVIEIVVAPTDAEFRALQPGNAPSWADAVAYPSRGVVYVRAPAARGGDAAPLEQVLDHELVHVLLGRAFAPQRPPSWLQEGVAQVLAGEADPSVAETLRHGQAAGELPSLASLERGFPRDAVRARVAYAATADFVAWLAQTHGPDTVPGLIRAVQAGDGLAAAVRGVTGRSLDAVEADWRARWATTDVRWASLLSDSWLLGLGGVLLTVGGVQRKRAFRRRMEELAREEAALDAWLAQGAARRTA